MGTLADIFKSDSTRFANRHSIVEAFRLPVEPTEDDNQAFHAWADRVGLEWESERHGVVVFRTRCDPEEPEHVNGAKGGDWIAKAPDGTFFARTADRFAADYERMPA